MMRRHSGRIGYHQYVLFAVICILTLCGLVLVYSSSAFVAVDKKKDAIAYVIKQLISCGVGFAGLFLFWNIDYLRLKKLSKVFLGLTFLFLILVLVLPAGSAKVHRYIHLGPVNVIPSEFAKITLILYLAAAFSRKQDLMSSFWRGAFPQLCVIGLVCLLVFMQPSHTNAIFLGMIGFFVWFFAGASGVHLAALITPCVAGSFFLIYQHSYAWDRITKFMETVMNPLSRVNYHTYQATLSMINGGIFGVGLGNSQQVLHYLPEPHTDFLWAVLGEELGFIRAIGLLVLYFIVVFMGYQIALNSRDLFAKFTAAGITTCFALQCVMHLFVVTSLMPTTGVALPLMSYGGSSLVVTLGSLGILMSIARYAGHFELEG